MCTSTFSVLDYGMFEVYPVDWIVILVWFGPFDGRFNQRDYSLCRPSFSVLHIIINIVIIISALL